MFSGKLLAGTGNATFLYLLIIHPLPLLPLGFFVFIVGARDVLAGRQPMRQMVVWRPQMVVIVELMRNGGNDGSKKIPGDDRYDRMP